MEIQQLRHLQAAANSQSYAQAAKKCFTSRQNIAHSVKTLEGEVGTPLFERKGNRMVLTEEGRQVAYVVDEVLERVDRLGSMFQDGLAARSMLNLAVSTNFFAGMPLAVDELLLERSSSFRFFERDCGECYRLVCSNEVDAAIIMCMEREFSDCSVVEVGRSKSYVIANEGSDLAKKESVSVDELQNEKLLLMSEPGFQYRPLFSQLCAIGYNRSSVSILPSTSSMLHMVRTRRGGSVGIASRRFAVTPPGGSVSIPLADPRLDWHFYALYKPEAVNSHAIASFIQDIRVAFSQSDGWNNG